jgi:hypothetical protein
MSLMDVPSYFCQCNLDIVYSPLLPPPTLANPTYMRSSVQLLKLSNLRARIQVLKCGGIVVEVACEVSNPTLTKWYHLEDCCAIGS